MIRVKRQRQRNRDNAEGKNTVIRKNNTSDARSRKRDSNHHEQIQINDAQIKTDGRKTLLECAKRTRIVVTAESEGEDEPV